MNDIKKSVFPNLPPVGMLLFTSISVLVIGFVFQLLAALTAILFFDVSLYELADPDQLEGLSALNAIKYMQIIGAIGTFIFSSLLLSFLYTGSWTAFFPLREKPLGSSVIMMILIMVAALPFVNFLTELNGRLVLPFESLNTWLHELEDKTEELMMRLLEAKNIGGLAVNLFMIALIPALGEELVFRGLIQRHFSDALKNPHIAILLTSVIFSIVHMQIFSFLPRFFLGMILGYLFYYGKSLWYPMIAHFVNNTLGVLFYYFFFMKSESADKLEDIGTPEMMPVMALISLLTVGLLFYGWLRIERSSRSLQAAGRI